MSDLMGYDAPCIGDDRTTIGVVEDGLTNILTFILKTLVILFLIVTFPIWIIPFLLCYVAGLR